ncbi:hypothetical protein PR048_002205 [Dryococelus australis]|uniref:Uncharacterized protein n=1 Tax=Dryococelus australis TaxID=614101 RepID=A0ABQ9IKX5_9NEOP|nr:hypothetical protein PR048_002205 [Dryococelus australis]
MDSLVKLTIVLYLVSCAAWFDRSISESGSSRGSRGQDKPRTLSLDMDKLPGGGTQRRLGANRLQPAGHSNTKVLVVWVESYEDHYGNGSEKFIQKCGFAGNRQARRGEVWQDI